MIKRHFCAGCGGRVQLKGELPEDYCLNCQKKMENRAKNLLRTCVCNRCGNQYKGIAQSRFCVCCARKRRLETNAMHNATPSQISFGLSACPWGAGWVASTWQGRWPDPCLGF